MSERWIGDDPASSAWMEEDQGADPFDRLPDSILILVFNGIGDVKALGRCCAVSRRFRSLVFLVDNVSVRVDCVISDHASNPSSSSVSPSEKTRNALSHFARSVMGGFARHLYALGQILSSSSSSSSSKRLSYAEPSSSEVYHYSPSEVLKNFNEIRRLRIELPAGELGLSDGALLKWKADFGSTISSCVILGASSIFPSSPHFENPSPAAPDPCCEEDGSGIPESFYANGGLKLRVVWTISSLIAASARHFLLQPIVADHPTLEFLDLLDADGQGLLSMNRGQLLELALNPVSASGSSQRTLMPALSMRLWYEPMLEIPCGTTLKGATLVAIQPSDEPSRELSADFSWVSNAFQEPYRTAARLLLQRRSYFLEMNSF